MFSQSTGIFPSPKASPLIELPLWNVNFVPSIVDVPDEIPPNYDLEL